MNNECKQVEREHSREFRPPVQVRTVQQRNSRWYLPRTSSQQNKGGGDLQQVAPTQNKVIPDRVAGKSAGRQAVHPPATAGRPAETVTVGSSNGAGTHAGGRQAGRW